MNENEPLHFHYDVDGNNFTSAGEASVQVKRMLRQMGFHPDLIRRISVAMYEGEINMVIHAKGGDADVYVTPVPASRMSILRCRKGIRRLRTTSVRSVSAQAWVCRI